MARSDDNPEATDVDVVIVGAGFAGLYLVHQMRRLGVSFRAFEAAPDVGGTWYWNRYPGARCDVASLEYSYSFLPELETEWRWTERFATQPEILRYAGHVANKLALRSAIAFNTRVTGAVWDEDALCWVVRTDQGEKSRARHVIMATGCLSTPTRPAFAGMDRFRGEMYHTGTWPDHPVTFEGKRVGVIGTGSSGVQIIPEVAKTAGHLHVFQRTPHFSIPAGNRPLDEDTIDTWHRHFPQLRRIAREHTRTGWNADFPLKSALSATPEEREAEYARRWAVGGPSFLYAYNDIGTNLEANATAAEFVRARIREIVKDPATAAKLVPHGYPIGAKRITLGTDFYETFNRPNVSLVDALAAPIVELTESGIRTQDAEYPLDMIIFATGFDAMTGALLRMDVSGVGAMSLRDKWCDGPVNYLGVSTAGFPNFHMITGPGSPSVLSNVIMSIEQHVEWVSDLLAYMHRHGYARIEATPAAERDWVDHCADVAAPTLISKGNSWYVGANIPGKPRVFLPYVGGVDAYRRRCNAVAAQGYEGFRLSRAAVPARDQITIPAQRAV